VLERDGLLAGGFVRFAGLYGDSRGCKRKEGEVRYEMAESVGDFVSMLTRYQ
jgi:hypothetical protein